MTTPPDPGRDAAEPEQAPHDAAAAVPEPSPGNDRDDVDAYADPELETPHATY
jgi:hypothetical protein